MKLSIIIPVYKTPPSFIEKILIQLNELAPDAERVIVSDREPDFQTDETNGIFLAPRRGGFAATANFGAQQATGDVLLFLNPDMELVDFDPSALLARFEAEQRLGVLGAKLLYPGRTIQFAGGYMNHVFGHHYAQGFPDEPMWNQAYYCPWLTGAFFAVRRECWEQLGGFDQSYFFFCEDNDFCLRAWVNYWKCLYDPKFSAVHFTGGTRNNLDPMEKEWVGIKAAASQKLFHERMLNFPLNDVNYAVWKANRELAPGEPSGKVLILERTGATGDVVLATGILPSLAQNHPDWSLYFRTGSPDVFRDSPFVTASEKINAPLALTLTLNSAYELRPNFNLLDAYCAELEKYGFNAKPGKPEIYPEEGHWSGLVSRHPQIKNKPYVVLHPSCSWIKNRVIERETYGEIALSLRRMGIPVVIVGTQFDEWPYSKDLDLRGQTTIHELYELIRHSQLFVGGDSFPLHVAQAAAHPSIGLFTNVRPELRLAPGSNLIGIGPSQGCRYCYEDVPNHMPSPLCPKNQSLECCRNFSVAEIMNKIREVMSGLA